MKLTKEVCTRDYINYNVTPNLIRRQEMLPNQLLRNLEFEPCDSEIQQEQQLCLYNKAVSAQITTLRQKKFQHLANFIKTFHKLLQTNFRVRDDSKRKKNYSTATQGTLEQFQKMLLMHVSFFLSGSDVEDDVFREIFQCWMFTSETVRHFKQRAAVFLVPRRHGKTWFLVPLIAILITHIAGIRIGYTAHLHKAVEFAFEEIKAKVFSLLKDGCAIEHCKGEYINYIFPNGSTSTAVFTSSYNANVSLFCNRVQPVFST